MHECSQCAKCATCTRATGIIYGGCAVDFVPTSCEPADASADNLDPENG